MPLNLTTNFQVALVSHVMPPLAKSSPHCSLVIARQPTQPRSSRCFINVCFEAASTSVTANEPPIFAAPLHFIHQESSSQRRGDHLMFGSALGGACTVPIARWISLTHERVGVTSMAAPEIGYGAPSEVVTCCSCDVVMPQCCCHKSSVADLFHGGLDEPARNLDDQPSPNSAFKPSLL